MVESNSLTADYQPSVSIIIPTRNEAQDIAETLEACLAISYASKEILVVDDSTDNTPGIIADYAERGVRLIHRQYNANGCCGARNLGMQLAHGEIIIIINADARPFPDFIQRLLPHYEGGADYVVVKSVVSNRDNLWGRYTWCNAQKYFSTAPDMNWSEGFSCRKSAIEQVGYIPGDFKVPFCRDFLLGVSLNQAGFTKHTDWDISVEHIVPGTREEYWRNQVWRGTFSAPYMYFFRNMPLPIIVLRETLKAVYRLLKYMLVIPAVWKAADLVTYSSRGRGDLLSLIWAGLVQDLATQVGNVRGIARLVRLRIREHRPQQLNSTEHEGRVK